MTDAITIRHAWEEDILPLSWLERAAFPDPWPPDLIAHEVRHPSAVVLAACEEGSDTPLGYASFHCVAGESELLRLAVFPEQRRRGIARRLLEHGFERLRDLEIEVCFLEVREDNDGAIALYRDFGFEYAGRRRGYYRDGTDALVLTRRVAPA
ncbi:MAG TPA: ribosomal protein S18-alanine N-acetyltransferase [Thermoanaerobaculia bacterium]|nr:ribosomal protein S18-alanine N-acetyltransferase [Thermoanaerobaculia bacterium]